MRSRIAANKCRVTATSASWNFIDPFRNLTDVLRRLPTTAPDRLAELLPDVWFQGYLRAAINRARSWTKRFGEAIIAASGRSVTCI
jgi:hypothetical protein